MKRFALMSAALLTVGLGTTFATTTDALQITLGTLTATIDDNGTCTGTGCSGLSADLNPVAGTDTVSGHISNWTISITSGTSDSPSDVPVGLDLTSLTATCSSTCASATLGISFSDINFSPANPEFLNQYSTTINGTGGST